MYNEQVLLGDLEHLIQTEYDKLYAYIFRLTESHHDTEDVMQNAFIKAYTKIHQFTGNAKLSTWVYRIATKEAYRYMEKWRKLPLKTIVEKRGISEKEFFKSLEYTHNFDDQMIIEEMREKCIFGFLKCVPKRQRICFLIKTCLGLKNREIAEIMDTTEGNVKVLLHRGKKQLQEMFDMRCSLIDPEKPCKCYLWIHFIQENGLPIPEGYHQYKHDELLSAYYNNMAEMQKIDYLYQVQHRLDKKEFINRVMALLEAL